VITHSGHGAMQIEVTTSLPIGRGAVNLCRLSEPASVGRGPALAERRDHSRVIRLAVGDPPGHPTPAARPARRNPSPTWRPPSRDLTALPRR
jgi:hypothetical protein